MIWRHRILILLSGLFVYPFMSGCSFDRRPATEDQPAGLLNTKKVTASDPEKVVSPYGPYQAASLPKNPYQLHEYFQPVKYADILQNATSGASSVPPEPPTIFVEQASSPLPTAPTQEPEPALLAALRCVLERNPAEALDLLKQYDKTTQELLVLLLPFTARLSEGGLERASPQEMSAMLDQLNDLMSNLRTKAPLAIKKLCFCQRINGFGEYETLQANPIFHGGIGNSLGERVQIYAELRNFRTIPKGNKYETHLVTCLEICDGHDPKGKPIKILQIPGQNLPTKCHSPRQDYFMNIQFHLPPMPDGQYSLWVVVEDRTCYDGEQVPPRMTRRQIDFQVSHISSSRASVEAAKARSAD